MALIELIVIPVLVVIALLVCILFIPFCLSFSFTKKKGDDVKTEFEISWLWGLIKKKFKKSKTEKIEIIKEIIKEEKSITDQFKAIYDSMQYPLDFFGLFYPFLKFARNILFSFKIKELKLRVNVGFSEPHYTGFLAGCLYAFRGLTYAAPINRDIIIEPDFNALSDADEIKLDVFLKTVFEVRIINLVIAVFSFILSKNTIRVIWKFIADKISFIS